MMKTCKERMMGEEIEIREENKAIGDSKHGEQERWTWQVSKTPIPGYNRG